jgi:hypothetical protein
MENYNHFPPIFDEYDESVLEDDEQQAWMILGAKFRLFSWKLYHKIILP